MNKDQIDETAETRFWSTVRVWLVVIACSIAIGPSGRAEEQGQPAKPSTAESNPDTKKASTIVPPPTTGSSDDRIQYVGPDTYILLDSAGRPQPLPGMSYEDFLAAWKQINRPKSTDTRPSYSIESLNFKGQVFGQRAELDCDITVRLLADEPVNIPLGLVGAILQGEPHFGSTAKAENPKAQDTQPAGGNSAQEHLTNDPDHGGYTAHFIGHSGDKRTLSLQLIVPLLRDGPETTLPLNCPRALSSQLALTVDADVSEARANSGAILPQESTKEGKTVVRVTGPVGLFRLTWQSALKDSPAITSVLNALGAIHVTIDGRGVRSEARLTVRSYGGTFDQFRVRLPLGAQLIQARTDISHAQDVKYRIRVEPESPDSTKGKSDDHRQIVVVELPEKQQGPVVVDLATEQSIPVENRDQEINVAGFEVVGAVRQFGDVALTVVDDWQARWEVGPFVRQVDPSDLDASLQSSTPTAAFQYDRQPWSLNVRVAPRQLRVHVTPKFELECLPEETRLTVRLNYQVFGARAFEFRIDLNGWEMTGDPVESGSLVDQDRITVTPKGVLVLPLTQASSRRADISFTLRRAATHDASRLELPLPVPSADSVGTGDLTVRTAPDLELLPDLSTSSGLSALPTPQESVTANDGANELHFRTLLPAPVFVADRTTRAREISTQTATDVEVGQGSAQVDERIEYFVRFEPLTELALEVPNEFTSGSDGLDISLLTSSGGGTNADEHGTPLHLNPQNDTAAAESSTRQLRVMLPRPRIGKFTARIRYRVPLPKTSSVDTEWSIPLARIVDGRSTSNQLAIRAPRNLSISLNSEIEDMSWTSGRSTVESNAPTSSYSFAAEAPELYLPVNIRAGRTDLPSSTTVERAWVQTWLTSGIEQDRAAFRFRTTDNQATIELPPDTAAGEVEVLVDREPAEIVSRAPGRIVVSLGTAATVIGDAHVHATPHTLELRSRQSYRRSILNKHQLTPPQIEGSTALSQVCWQIVLPSDEHVIEMPSQLTSASEWQWLGIFLGRQPLKSQGELEKWVGASEQLAPADAQNQYLFTGLLPISTIEITTGPRWLIVLCASSVVLALTISWLYVPDVQRIWFLVVLVFVVFMAAFTYPTMALLLAQASIVGVILSALSIFLSRRSAWPRRSLTPPIISSSSQKTVTPRSDSIFLPPAIAAASTAPTSSLRGSDSGR
ncbi:MAG TPA: hypothetical protein VHU84_11315 [Lacipirellulaceae bacterium]|nr:hypothetical protein [Lacipirellulaceae bacterium]